MHRRHSPSTVPPPASRYSQAIEARSGLRWLYLSGQIGVDSEGRLAAGDREQHEQVWRNILALLLDAGMAAKDLVRVNAYVTGVEQVALFREARDRALEGAEPASTLVVVAGLIDPRWKVEIDAVAASD